MFPLRTSVEVDEISSAVIGLIVANVAVFLVQIELPESLREAFLYRYALVPARYTQPDFTSGLVGTFDRVRQPNLEDRFHD